MLLEKLVRFFAVTCVELLMLCSECLGCGPSVHEPTPGGLLWGFGRVAQTMFPVLLFETFAIGANNIAMAH